MWIQDSFRHSSICHRLLLEAIHQSGSVQRHILVGNKICAVMTLKVFNNLLAENQCFGHLRRSASPLLAPPVPLPPSQNNNNGNFFATTTPTFSRPVVQNQQNINETSTTKNKTTLMNEYKDLDLAPRNNQINSSSSIDNNNTNNVDEQQQPQLLHDVWKIPLWIVCSDRNFENLIDNNNQNPTSEIPLLECGELPDIYRLVEACSYRDVEAPWVWFVTKN